MRKRVILTLIKGSFEQGFPAILRIREGSTLHETETLGRLPPALNILQVFNNWQAAYDQWQSTYRIKANPGQVTNFSCREIASLGSHLADALNSWLNSDSREWQIIRDQLQRSLNEADEIQFIIQTEDIRLRQLPWHLWDLFSEHYTKTEIALSAPQYQPPPPPNLTNKVKILAILGDSTGINVEQDKAILQKELPDAEIKFLTQPELKLLNDSLWEQQWDILFFAGHSASQADGSTGQIYINQDDSLLLSDLRNALRKAISRGLQLAIFNSCDGLGLAQGLADLNIPQIIVMRKPVPDFVAQEFLRHFLKVFASGKSLYLAVREAREKLQGLENQFPCASWLPMIYQNPTKEPLTWQGLALHPKSIRQRWLLLLQQAIVFLLPILILSGTEPSSKEAEARNNLANLLQKLPADRGHNYLPRTLADVNGDGQTDYCRFVGDLSNLFIACALGNSDGFGDQYAYQSIKRIDKGYDGRPRGFRDANSDGRADYCRFVGDSPNIYESCNLATPLGFDPNQYTLNRP